jgi:hypothetical protein
MVNAPNPKQASYLSTGVVSRALGLDQAAVRAMIEIGTLPDPQWMTVGTRVERIYSLEWLVLASEQLNVRRLSGLEFEIAPKNTVQFALRFERTNWALSDVTKKLVALGDLWNLCAITLGPNDETLPPSLHVRRLSAGSPLDLLAWVPENWPGLAGVGGVGGVVALFIYVLKNPEKVASAIPRSIAAWREGWASADEAAIHQASARINRKRFELESARILNELDAVPSDTALSGKGTSRLEILTSGDEQNALEEVDLREQRPPSDSDEDNDVDDGPGTIDRS